MFLGCTNPKLCVCVNPIVLDFCNITEPRKKQLKVEILHDLKEFWNSPRDSSLLTNRRGQKV